ncbi:hypothetical protein JCM33374_g2940 [Metschnikowia sp. JCM 33374]|nr:hypothetical protein JCM33374_g2940 [Metschnikowia sp. JCM 33374]
MSVVSTVRDGVVGWGSAKSPTLDLGIGDPMGQHWHLQMTPRTTHLVEGIVAQKRVVVVDQSVEKKFWGEPHPFRQKQLQRKMPGIYGVKEYGEPQTLAIEPSNESF